MDGSSSLGSPFLDYLYYSLLLYKLYRTIPEVKGKGRGTDDPGRGHVQGDAGVGDGEGRHHRRRGPGDEGHGAGRARLRPRRLPGEAHRDAPAEEYVGQSDRAPRRR